MESKSFKIYELKSFYKDMYKTTTIIAFLFVFLLDIFSDTKKTLLK